MPNPKVRHYTADELTTLLETTQAPLNLHHPGIGLLISMAMLLSYLQLAEQERVFGDAEWPSEVGRILHRQVLFCTAEVLRHGVTPPVVMADDGERVH